jgi:hypothetical protein
VQDGAGSRTITWDAEFLWSNGAAPTLSTGAGAMDIITFLCDGAHWCGVPAVNFS